jgi:hypothetical protein
MALLRPAGAAMVIAWPGDGAKLAVMNRVVAPTQVMTSLRITISSYVCPTEHRSPTRLVKRAHTGE